MALLKPVIYLTIDGKRFHWATTLDTPDARITKLVYEETDGTGKHSSHKKDKGKRDSLKFTFVNYNDETQTFLTDTNVFRVGSLVKFRFGFEGTFSLSPWRSFKIVEVEETFPDNGSEMVTVVCHDLSKDMNNVSQDVARPKTKLKKKEDQMYTLADVVSEVAKEDGFTYTPTEEVLKEPLTHGWQQKKETNIQFLQRLAKDYGMDVFVKEKVLHFESRAPVVKQPEWGVLYRGADEEYNERVQKNSGKIALVLAFTPKVNLEDSAASSESTDASSSTNKKTTSKSENTRRHAINSGDFKDRGLVEQPAENSKDKKANDAPLTDADAKAKASANQQLSNDSAITADVTCEGHPGIVYRSLYRLGGRISKRWKGKLWYAETVTHEIDDNGGYKTTLNLSLTPPVEASADANKADASKNNKTPPKGSGRVPVNSGSFRRTDGR